MKMIYSSTEPASSDLYVHRFITNKEIYDDLQRQFPKLPEYYSFQQVANWISGERDHFGPLKTHNVHQVPKKGRWLWVVKEEATGKKGAENQKPQWLRYSVVLIQKKIILL